MSAHPAHEQVDERRSDGERVADWVVAHFGSGRFIVAQTILVAAWIALNLVAVSMRWDPYPFILLNLAFSTQAAYAAPLILLAQNRQDQKDRAQAAHDYQVNEQALDLVSQLHAALDELRCKACPPPPTRPEQAPPTW